MKDYQLRYHTRNRPDATKPVEQKTVTAVPAALLQQPVTICSSLLEEMTVSTIIAYQAKCRLLQDVGDFDTA